MATRCYFNHCAVQRRTRKPEAVGDDKLVIRLILERVSGSLVRSAGEFIVETSTPLAEKEIWADFCRIKQFSSDASIESETAHWIRATVKHIWLPKDEVLSSQLAAAVSWYLRTVVIGKPGTPIFEAIVYVLKKGEGGRHSPLFAGYRPQFYLM
ncbi:hypothetical protein M0R45_000984 [Rubus argutus]|uniref:Translation elongation factor EFTu/EF1A C-terminal domain-containing protein n=1 Tax=Rubus argutus TaxID=59490 RepID=A0AAW1VJB8_RUBAR